jgi:hypothetical protein
VLPLLFVAFAACTQRDCFCLHTSADLAKAHQPAR